MNARSKTIWLVRHGDTVWSESGRIAGRSDIDLSEKGEARVVQLAGTMTELVRQARWYASPLKRTRQTTRLLRGALDDASSAPSPVDRTRFTGEVSFDERLVEFDFGDWEGSSWQAVHQEQGDVLSAWGRNWVSTAPPNGESFEEQYERCAAWFSDWESSVDGSTGHAESSLAGQSVAASDDAVVVTHGGSIRALLCRLLNRPLEQAMSWSVDLACVYCFSWNEAERRWLLRAANHRSF